MANGDPKITRFEAYETLRSRNLIEYNDAQMESYMQDPARREQFHSYLKQRNETSFADFNEWDQNWFPEYHESKKKDGGVDSSVSSSATTEPVEPAITPEEMLQQQGVALTPPAPQPIAAPTAQVSEVPDALMGMEPAGQVQAESTAMPKMAQMLQLQQALQDRQESYTQAMLSVDDEALRDPARAFDLLSTDDNAKLLHNDPKTSDWTKGLLKARTFEDATELVVNELSVIGAGIGEPTLRRYSDAKGALIEIGKMIEGQEQVDLNAITYKDRTAQQWLDDYDLLRASDPNLQQYDSLNEKLYALQEGYGNIRVSNPEYFDDIDRRRAIQTTADIADKMRPKPMTYVQAVPTAVLNEAAGLAQGLVAFVGAAGNSYETDARYNWADRVAEFAARNLDAGMWSPMTAIPSKFNRSIFTNTAKVNGYQLDIDSQGNVSAVRDGDGYIVNSDRVRQDVIDTYEAAPDIYDINYRPHLAPMVTVATQGAVQMLVTSRFAGLGKTAAAAKGYAAGMLTARFAGQNYVQALQEWGPENAGAAARFAISTAAMQTAVSLYVNPLEIKAIPRDFQLSNKALRRVASDLKVGKTMDAAMRNGYREQANSLIRGISIWGKNVGAESLEGVMETAIDIGGRRVVRTMTDINVEIDESGAAFFEGLVSEGVGSMIAAGMAVDTRNQLQVEQMLVAYEHQQRILPMIKEAHGQEASDKLQAVFAAFAREERSRPMDRLQKQNRLVELYNQETITEQKETDEGTQEVQPTPPPTPQAEVPQEEEGAPIVEPTVHDIVKEEALALRLMPGDTYTSPGGTPFTVLQETEEGLIVRNEDTGRAVEADPNQLRETLKQHFEDRIARQFPNMSRVRLLRLREAASIAVEGQLPAAPERAALPPAPEQTPTEQATLSAEPPAAIAEPTPTQGDTIIPTEEVASAEALPFETVTADTITQVAFTNEGDGEVMANALRAVSQISPNLKVQVYENADALQQATGRRGNAFVSSDGQTIYLSKESTAADVQHEVLHPIVVAEEMKTPGTIASFYDEIFTTMPEQVRRDMEAVQQGYADESKERQLEEVVVEFLTRLADGQYDQALAANPTAVQRFVNWFKELFSRLGIANAPEDAGSLRDFARRVLPMLQRGEAIAAAQPVAETVSQPATEAMEPSFRNEDEWFEWVAQESTDPIEISEAYIASKELDKKEGQRSYKDQVIIDSGLDKMSRQDFGNYLDPNYLKGDQGLVNRHIDSRAKNDIDDRIQSASDQFGIEVTIDDVVDYIERSMRNQVDRRRAGELSDRTRSLGSRYQEVTGRRMTIQTARKNVRDALKAIDEQFDKYLIEDGKSQEELEAAYYQAIQEGRIPPPEDIARGSIAKGIQEISEAEFEGLTEEDAEDLRRFKQGLEDLEGTFMRQQGLEDFDDSGPTPPEGIDLMDDDLKARITQEELSEEYWRARKWMKMVIDPKHYPKADVVADAVNMFGVTQAQAEIMYDVLLQSPDMRGRYIPPPGVDPIRKGIFSVIDRTAQFWNKWMKKSQGLPKDVMIAMEYANGEAERLTRLAMDSYARIQILLNKSGDRKQELTDIANRFVEGTATVDEVSRIGDEKLYAELLFLRSALDEVSLEILNEENFSELRNEIIAENFGEYLNRAFRVHMVNKHTPTKAAVEAFMKEYRRREYDNVAQRNPTKTPEQIKKIVDRNGRRFMRTLLREHGDSQGRGQSKSGKPRGIMKERKSFPKSAGLLVEFIDKNGGKMPLTPSTGPITPGPGYSQEFVDLFNAAWDEMRRERLREAYFTNEDTKREYAKAERLGTEFLKIAASQGAVVPGSNPFSRDQIRQAVEDRAPIVWNVPGVADPDAARRMGEIVREVNDIIVGISNEVYDRVQSDIDTIIKGGNYLQGTGAWRDMEHLLPGIRAILGEIPPLEAAVISMAKLANHYTLGKYYKVLKATGENEFLFAPKQWKNPNTGKMEATFDTAPEWADTNISAEGSAAFSPLDGMRTSKEIADVITNLNRFGTLEGYPLVTALKKITGWTQYGKTILSPATQGKNFLSNIWFVVRNIWANPLTSVMAFGLVPADLLLNSLSKGTLRMPYEGIRVMSDALLVAYKENFGRGFSAYKTIKPADVGFAASDPNFLPSMREIKGRIATDSKEDIIADVIGNYGITEDQARSLYAALQQRSFKDDMAEVINILGSAGVLGSSVSLRSIHDKIDAVNTEEKAARYITDALFYQEGNPVMRAANQAGSLVRKGVGIAESAYSFGDDVFKIFGYLQERNAYSKILFTKPFYLLNSEQQAEVNRRTIENVKNIIPNYNRLGEMAKVISNSPFIGNFIAFKIEALRVWYNGYQLGINEIRDGKRSGNNRMVRHGAKRLAGNVTATGMAFALEKTIIAMAGNAVASAWSGMGNWIETLFDDDEDEGRKKLLRLYQLSFTKNDWLVPIEIGDGVIATVSISQNHPFGDLQRATILFDMKVNEDEPWVQAAAYAVWELFGSLGDVKIFTNVLMEVRSNKDTYGNPIFEVSDTPEEKYRKSLQYMIKRAGPGFIGQFSRSGLFEWLPKDENFGFLHKPPWAGDTKQEVIGMVTGMRPIKRDIYRIYERTLREFSSGYAREGIDQGIYGNVEYWNVNIDNATMEDQIRQMVEKESTYIRNLQEMYHLPLKYGVATPEGMAEAIEKAGPPKRLKAMIHLQQYGLPMNKINKMVAGRRNKVDPNYQMSAELEKWLNDFAQKANR